MVLLVTTARIISALEAIPPSSRKDLDLPTSLVADTPISHDQLVRLSRYLYTNALTSPQEASLNSLLRGTRIYVPPPPKKPEPSPEYLALKARLLAAAEADAYHRMTTSAPSPQGPSPIFSSSTPTLSSIHDSSSAAAGGGEDPLTPSLVLNIFLSVLITGFSVYWALTSFRTPDLLVSSVSSVWRSGSGSSSARTAGVSEPVKVLVSLLTALVVGVAEVLIYAIYLQKVERARAREARIKERKEVIGRDEVQRRNDGQDVQMVGGDKEEIWGRGANGGVRRRVREKWEEKEREKGRGKEAGDEG
ncbi:TMEM199/VMA12 family protein [Aspergillus clavatus NRRL 1]|uniref:Endoplasmic reticulum-based factor for assembly of V-ATPase-domain-containing protein n=1 Tax=Aspergillus clavatus (strain ATCC 1007 / CBS 513.65 / DSM 816 / NCTC 3887 / NRRL 1 / QM 1276 / 107) TaxID=344612 RepID=A1CFB1_ASPCL|nr:uncharacterized protein ACLA_092580 [Aspergillus clavatus NRRL 1]EAW11560.1 conserved hypothetical protein [Aspergillus clavatus NRRL 1]